VLIAKEFPAKSFRLTNRLDRELELVLHGTLCCAQAQNHVKQPMIGDPMARLRRNIEEMAGYTPGFQPKNPDEYIKLNTNENPYPPSPKVIEAILAQVGDGLRKYPDAKSAAAAKAVADLHGFDPDWVVIANGSDEVLNNLIRAFAGEGDEIAYLHPSYSYYATLALIQGATVRTFKVSQQGEILELPERYEGKLFFLTNPNAPFGFCFPISFVEELAARVDGILVVDEAYADFAEENALDLVRKYDNVVVTRTLSKSYSLAGMRIGYAIARPYVVSALNKIRDHYNLDKLAQAAATAAIGDQGYFLDCVKKIKQTRQWFTEELRKLGFSVIPSSGNYVFATPPDRNGKRVHDELAEKKILVRHFSDPLLSQGVRISIGSREEMEKTLRALQS